MVERSFEAGLVPSRQDGFARKRETAESRGSPGKVPRLVIRLGMLAIMKASSWPPVEGVETGCTPNTCCDPAIVSLFAEINKAPVGLNRVERVEVGLRESS
ncbi:MAG: hypothetical protein FJW26_12640 [Acidimicrobiia bacterium]|nr:hypothetical protein [Acidimicrobiia bacterium]